MPRPARHSPTPGSPSPRPAPRRSTRGSTCARPDCAEPIAAWLTYDYGARCLWLDDGYAAGDCWPLCASHASRLRAPKGWTQLDRRAGALPP